MAADIAARKHALTESATKALCELRRASRPAGAKTEDETPAVVLWVPGRIEFLGKHTDYAGGRSLLCAIERGICTAARPRDDALVRVHDARIGETVECTLDASFAPGARAWGVYPATVERRVARNFPHARVGADIAFHSDLPVAAGISSSSALVVSIFLALSAINRLAEHESYHTHLRSVDDLAGYLGCVENGFDFGELTGDAGVGTLSGCEDQTAMLCARPDALIQYSFCPVRYEGVAPVPVEHRFVIVTSGVAAEKTASAQEKYNLLARRARAAAAAWRASSGREDATLGDAVRAAERETIRSAIERATVTDFSSRELVDRFDQFHVESEVIVPRVADALRRGNLLDVGALVDESQSAAERLLGNQIPETVALARSARELGAVAASAFGAGFGGSVWALVADEGAADFLDRWRGSYLRAFPSHREAAQFFETRAGSAAARLA